MLRYSLAIVLLVTLAACQQNGGTEDSSQKTEVTEKAAKKEGPMITGAISYRNKIGLPPDADIIVQILDVTDTRMINEAPVVAQRSFPAESRQVPINFDLPYRKEDIKSDRVYVLNCKILYADTETFHMGIPPEIINNGRTSNIALMLTSGRRPPEMQELQ